MKIFNKSQRITLLIALIAFLLIGLVPPWRYLDGSSAGFHPVFSPPPYQADSLAGQPAPEHAEIHLIPLAMYNMERRNQFNEEERIRPYLDIRRMQAFATFIFLGTIVALIVTNRSNNRYKNAQ